MGYLYACLSPPSRHWHLCTTQFFFGQQITKLSDHTQTPLFSFASPYHRHCVIIIVIIVASLFFLLGPTAQDCRHRARLVSRFWGALWPSANRPFYAKLQAALQHWSRGHSLVEHQCWDYVDRTHSCHFVFRCCDGLQKQEIMAAKTTLFVLLFLISVEGKTICFQMEKMPGKIYLAIFKRHSFRSSVPFPTSFFEGFLFFLEEIFD